MILVAGGTGTLGTRLVATLAGHQHEVRILARNPAAGTALPASVEVVQGDVRQPRDVERAVAGVRTIVSAITGFGTAKDVSARTVDWEGNANLIRAARAARVEHFILMSVCRAASDHPLELFRRKYRAEEELRASGLGWTIIRPTAYMETWIGLVGAPLLQAGRTRIFGRGENPINFVSAGDVARRVELAVTDPRLRGAAIDAGGPTNLTMKELVETFRAVTGARGKVSHVPLPMMRAMSVLMKPVNSSMAALIAAGVVMDTRDMTFDPSEADMRFAPISLTDVADTIRKEYGQARPTDVMGIDM
jgi:uncharacterized protein YbjT (DUF2867 family)